MTFDGGILFSRRCYHPNSARKLSQSGLSVSRSDWKEKKARDRPRGMQPYVPPRMQKPTTSSQVPPQVKKPISSPRVQIVDIFEGMTLVELAKRTGHSVSTLQNVLVNLGENAASEFDSLSLDVVELVALVFPSFSSKTS